MNKFNVLIIPLILSIPDAFAEDPYCMWGKNDILCESSRLLERYKDLPSGQEHVNEMAEAFKQGFSNQNPYSMSYNGAKDICIINGKSCMKKEMIHINWLHKKCTRGYSVACKKLKSGAYTPTPRDRYPGGGRINVPYSPGTEPVPGVDPYANIRSAP